ncbi:aminotransferase class I/II-fold pyridoxal phosphate-dependent enzyme [Nonomuraea sp. NPDC050404]|uniref:aminotransferase class I/II-fold pyridoxal phosphate-dependent enzyme n=1 Tax=Nonomuraea sp. NPDC050404 TaxID=3155783 RepID=UPI0033ECBA02
MVTTGYQANLALSALFAPDDVLFTDQGVHASLLDAARLGQAELRRFRHNDAVIRAEPERRQRVLAAARRLRADLTGLGFDTGLGITPAVPIRVGEPLVCMRLWRELLNEGVFTGALVPPAVPDGTALIRIGVTAAHSDAQLSRIAEACEKAGRRLGLIPARRPALTG